MLKIQNLFPKYLKIQDLVCLILRSQDLAFQDLACQMWRILDLEIEYLACQILKIDDLENNMEEVQDLGVANGKC